MNAWLALAGLGLCVAGLGLVWAMTRAARSDGAAAAQSLQNDGMIDAISQRKEIDNAVDALPADDARKRLQQWARD